MATMDLHDLDYDPEPTFAWAVRAGRAWTKQPLRLLARSSGVSAGQLNRLETGKVERPSLETVLALAPALNFHPTPLLVLAGHLTGSDARSELQRIARGSDAELRETYDDDYVDHIHERIESAASDEDLRILAMEVLTLDDSAADYPDAIGRAVPASMPDPDVLGRLLQAWRDLTPDRRWRLMETAEDMRIASAVDTELFPQRKPPTKEQ